MTYSNLSIKLWIDIKYVIELIPVKNYKKGFIISCGTDTKNIPNHSLKLAKLFSQ